MNAVPTREVGLIVADPTPALIGLIAVIGIDSVVLDAEQTGLTRVRCAEVVQALRGSEVRVGIRVPEVTDECLLSYANTGAGELVLPRLVDPEALDRAYRITRYPPEGERPRQVSAASQWGTDYGRPPVLSVLFETAAAVDAVAEFVAHPCFEGGWIGPTDLVDDLRRRGREHELDALVQRVIDTVAGAGHPIGIPAASSARADEAFARGATRSAIYWEREVGAVLRTLASART